MWLGLLQQLTFSILQIIAHLEGIQAEFSTTKDDFVVVIYLLQGFT